VGGNTYLNEQSSSGPYNTKKVQKELWQNDPNESPKIRKNSNEKFFPNTYERTIGNAEREKKKEG